MNRLDVLRSSGSYIRYRVHAWRYMHYAGRPSRALLADPLGRGLVAGYKWARDHADQEALRYLCGRYPDGVLFRGFEGLDIARHFVSTYRELPFDDVSDGEIYDFWGDLGLDEDTSDFTSLSFWSGFSQGAIEWSVR